MTSRLHKWTSVAPLKLSRYPFVHKTQPFNLMWRSWRKTWLINDAGVVIQYMQFIGHNVHYIHLSEVIRHTCVDCRPVRLQTQICRICLDPQTDSISFVDKNFRTRTDTDLSTYKTGFISIFFFCKSDCWAFTCRFFVKILNIEYLLYRHQWSGFRVFPVA